MVMENWHEKLIKALQLNGKTESTQANYIRTVRLIIKHCDKTPDLITEEDLQAYFLHRRNVSQWAPNTLKSCYAGARFFFENVLKRDWHIFKIARAKTDYRMPTVLTIEEVHEILARVTSPRNHAFLFTVYSCGLRLQEARMLQVSDIDSSRMMIHIHLGKGGKDRYVPLPKATLDVLRKHWSTHKNPRLIFPSRGIYDKGWNSETPISVSAVQAAIRQATRAAGIQKRGVSVHTLRHSYATHLLESGVNLRTIQRYLGHSCLDTTMIYLHLTTKGQEDAIKLIDNIMVGF
jgi:integrase/recombinase XerD